MLGLNRSEASLSACTETPLVPTLRTQWLVTVSPRMNLILSSEENQVWLRLTLCRARWVQNLGHDQVLYFHLQTVLEILSQYPQPLWLFMSHEVQWPCIARAGCKLRCCAEGTAWAGGDTYTMLRQKSWAKIYCLDTKSQWIQGFQCGLLTSYSVSLYSLRTWCKKGHTNWSLIALFGTIPKGNENIFSGAPVH